MKVSRDKWIAFAVALVMAMLTVVSIPAVAHAQAVMSVKIPFDFYVGSKKFSAGNCSVLISDTYLKVTDGQGHTSFAMTNSVANPDSKSSAVGKLLFTHYDSYYFLTEVRRSGYNTAQGLIRSPLEVQIARNSIAKEQLAFSTTH